MKKKFKKNILWTGLIFLIISSVPIYFSLSYIYRDYTFRHYVKHTVFPSIQFDIENFIFSNDLTSVNDQLPDSFKIKTIKLNISDATLQKLEEQRQKKLNTPHIVIKSNDNPFLKAEIGFRDSIYKVELRLRGDALDNYNRGLVNASFRINLEGDKELLGYKKFSLIRPFQENGLYGFFYYKYLEHAGLLSNDFHFVNVALNRKEIGIFILQESFEDNLYLSQERKPGLILKFEDDCLELGSKSYVSNFPRLVPYGKKKVLNDSVLSEFYGYVLQHIDLMLSSQISPDSIINYRAFAKFVACSDVFTAHHSQECHNVRLYFNPKTYKLEPIAWDPASFLFVPYSPPNVLFSAYAHRLPVYKFLAEDTSFVSLYLKELHRLSASGEINGFVDEYDLLVKAVDLKLNEYIGSPRFEKKTISDHLDNIRNQFYIKHKLNAFAYKESGVVTLKNNTFLPVYCSHILVNDSSIMIEKLIYPEQPLMISTGDIFPKNDFFCFYKLLNENQLSKEAIFVFRKML